MTTDNDAVRILACDDSETADADLAALVDHSHQDCGPPIKLVGMGGRARDATTAITRGRKTACNVILIDLVMPKSDRGGPSVFAAPWVARALTNHFTREDGGGKEMYRAPALVMWTSNPLKTVACEARAFVHHGGHQVIDKQATVQKQVERIRSAAVGDEAWHAPKDDLTDREREVLALIVDGWSQMSIADHLCLSFRTIEGYAISLRAKLNVGPGQGNGAGPLRAAAEREGISWTPAIYLGDPGDDPLSLAC